MGETPSSFQRGNLLYAQRQYESAVAAYLQHAEECPEEAAKAYAHAARCCPHVNTLKAPVPVVPGVTLVHQGDKTAGEAYCRAALALDPECFMALKQLAELLPQKSSERRSALERAAALRPDVLVLVDLGDYYRSVVKDLGLAHETYRRAVEATPKDETAYRRLSELCRRMGRAEEAKEWSLRWKEVDETRYRHR